MPASKVLGDDDLLGEILLRVDSPTALVRAALACKRWLRRASGRAFLRLFLARHPPRLLGFFVTGHCVPRPVFVPMPTLQDTDKALTAAVRRAGVGSGGGPKAKSHVLDCRNGRVLVGTFEIVRGEGVWRFAVLDPLRRPGRGGGTTVIPPPARLDCWPDCSQELLLPEDDEDGDGDASCYCVDVDRDDDGDDDGWSGTVQVSTLRSDGSWTIRSCARAKLATPPERVSMLTLLAGGKLYMLAEAGYLLGLDLAAARLFVLDLPDGVAFGHCGSLALSRADAPGAVFYLLHVKGLQLTVWLRRTDGSHGPGAGAGEWVLTDTVSVRETCGDYLGNLGIEEPADGEAADVVSVVGVGDNTEFAFLELGRSNGVVVYMHLASRTVEKVYQREPDNDHMIDVHPFLMLWPPVFPALLDADDGGEAHQE